MRRPRWFRRGGSVTWAELLAWAKAHGAVNDSITSIHINGVNPEDYWVVIEGHAHDDKGRPYLSPFYDGETAKWQTSHVLRYLP